MSQCVAYTRCHSVFQSCICISAFVLMMLISNAPNLMILLLSIQNVTQISAALPTWRFRRRGGMVLPLPSSAAAFQNSPLTRLEVL